MNDLLYTSQTHTTFPVPIELKRIGRVRIEELRMRRDRAAERRVGRQTFEVDDSGLETIHAHQWDKYYVNSGF